jgi:signal transduction histidine kinase/CheY-like chemotaxis protein
MAQAFGATGAGAAVLLQQVPVWQLREVVDGASQRTSRWPWEDCPDLFGMDWGNAETTVASTADGTSLLLARLEQTAESSWVVWLETNAVRSWSSEEKAALCLAATVLARWFRPLVEKTAWSKAVENKRWQRQLEEAAAVTGRLAHDFGNVLTGVLGFADLALAQISSASPLYRLVKEMYQAAQQGARMVQRLSLFSQRRSRPGQAASFPNVLGEGMKRTRSDWPTEVLYEQDLAASLPRVALDAEALGHVLGQLLANAREAIRGPGKVTLTAGPVTLGESDCWPYLGNPAPGDHLEVSIADTGCGIAPEIRQRLLTEVFVTTKPGHRGLGLGVVYGILQTNRGGFRLEPGTAGGTVARVVLPFVAAAVPGPVTKPKEKVLVVDDDPIILEMVCTILKRAGYRVQPAASGAEAIDSYVAAAPEPFGMVVTDVIMPAMNGFDLVRTLRVHDPKVKVMFITGQGHAPGADTDLAIENINLLPKPFRPDGLLQAVRATLDCGVTPCPTTA